MKKVFLAAALFLFTIIFLSLPRNTKAACFPPNDNTGLCDSGATCNSGLCCDNISQCPTPQPQATPQQNQAESPTCNDGKGIDTAIGCIPIGNTNDFIAFILRWAIGIGGGIAFLLIIVSGFQITTSSGNPERLKAGQELLTSAIAGLIMLIFSVFILRVIGVNILQLPGLK